jgi:hypothetical protein
MVGIQEASNRDYGKLPVNYGELEIGRCKW